MPCDLYVLCADLVPPSGKIILRDIKRCRSDEVVKDYIVLLAPAKTAEVIEVFIVKELIGDRFRNRVQRSLDKFGRKKNAQSRQL